MNTDEINQEEKPFFKVIVHSFFIIPFLIAVFCALLFGAMHMLTRETRTIHDYLNDVKVGGANKRWQGAFELSKILANPNLYPEDTQFSIELIEAFKHARHDDDRVRQYLALAMGRTRRNEFVRPLINGLTDEKENNLPALIYALGMLQDKEAAEYLHSYIKHPEARIRSIAVTALGSIAHPESQSVLRKGLRDAEPNVQWGAAISLANMNDSSGKDILLQMLNRNYFNQFSEVDTQEATDLISATIEAASKLKDPQINDRIKELAKSDKNMHVRSRALKYTIK